MSDERRRERERQVRAEGGEVARAAELQERCRRGVHDAWIEVHEGSTARMLLMDRGRRVVEFDLVDLRRAVEDLNAELMLVAMDLAYARPSLDGAGVEVILRCPVCRSQITLEARTPVVRGPCDSRAYREAAERALQRGWDQFEWEEELDPEESRFLPLDASFTPRTVRRWRIELQRFTFGCDCGQEWDDVLPKGYVVAPIPACPDCRERQPHPREVARMRAERDADQRLARRMGWPRGARGRARWLR